MSLLVTETSLSRLVTDFGDYALVHFTEHIYGSSFAKIVIFLAASMACLHFGRSLSEGLPLTRAAYFVFAWIMCFPVENKPFAFTLVDGFSNILKNSLEMANGAIFSHVRDTRDGKTGDKLPPWFVSNAILRAQKAHINSPEISHLVDEYLKCAPEPKQLSKEHAKKEAHYLNALFPKKIQSSAHGQSMEFADDGLKNLLKERPLPALLQETSTRDTDSVSRLKTCEDLASLLVGRIRSHVRGQGLIDSDTVQGSFAQMSEAPRVENFALNLAQSHATRKSIFDAIPDFFKKNMGSPSMQNVAHSSGLVSSLSYYYNSAYNFLARSFSEYKSLSIGQKSADISEKLARLPYLVALSQVLLKILCPLVLLSLFFGTLRFLSFWVSAFVLTKILPVVTDFFGLLLNHFMLLKMQLTGKSGEEHLSDSVFSQGMNIDILQDLFEDYNVLMDSMLLYQDFVLGLLASLFAVGAWVGSSAGQRVFQAGLGRVSQGFAARAATRAGALAKPLVKTTTSLAKLPKAGMAVGVARTASRLAPLGMAVGAASSAASALKTQSLGQKKKDTGDSLSQKKAQDNETKK